MPPSERYAFGDFLLDVGERSLARAGSAVPLKPKSFDLLVALVRRAGHLVRKEDLLAEVWPDAIVTKANLSHYVWVLGSALEEGDGGPLIETVPRAGYRFVAPVEMLAEPTAPVAAVAPAVEPGPSPAAAFGADSPCLPPLRPGAFPVSRHRAALAAGAAVLLALVGFGLRRLGNGAEPSPWRTSSSTASRAGTPAPGPQWCLDPRHRRVQARRPSAGAVLRVARLV